MVPAQIGPRISNQVAVECCLCNLLKAVQQKEGCPLIVCRQLIAALIHQGPKAIWNLAIQIGSIIFHLG